MRWNDVIFCAVFNIGNIAEALMRKIILPRDYQYVNVQMQSDIKYIPNSLSAKGVHQSSHGPRNIAGDGQVAGKC